MSVKSKQPFHAARAATVAMICGLAMFAASCAPIPPPGTVQPPPQEEVPVPAPRPASTVTTEPVSPGLEIHEEPDIDVGLAWDLLDAALAPSTAAVIRLSSPGFENAVDEAALQITARVGSGGWTLSWKGPGGEAGSIEPSPAETVWVAVPAGTIRWKDQTWRGTFKLFTNPRGTLTIATRLPLETYLLGVVPGEIGALSDQLVEAGRAQAIAARSYTLFYRGRRADEGFDVYGTVEDQLYVPIEREQPLATRCVESTRGMIAMYDDQPIRANYSSTCGGMTSEVWEAWPAEPLPYLSSHRDAGRDGDYCSTSSHYRWREEWPAAEFLTDLERFGREEGVPEPSDLGDLIEVQVAARSRSGRVWSLLVRTTNGDVVVPGRRLRWVLRRPGRPQSILRSNLFKIEVRRDPRTRRALAVVASGAGSGHGVGLCQVGAREMARAGIDARDIVLHYYTGVDLERRY